MKQQFLFQSLFAGLLLAGLWGCSEETMPSVTEGERQNSRLTVIVTDSGYSAPADEKPATRTKEEDYKTTFTTDDKIGLYAVKNNAIITGYNNVCLTLAADGKWMPPEGTKLFYEGSDVTYYVYYPYQADMTGKVTATATDATGFFKPLTDGWVLATDQSDYARYTASDLMTGKGTISNNPGSTRTLTVELTHRMAMAVVNLTRTKYTLDTDANYVWFIYPDDMKLDGLSPYQADNGSFRYLVKPAQTNLTLSGSYSNTASTTTEWHITANITAGSYKNYNVDGAVYTELIHTLTMGDFYMKDGSLLALADDGTLTDKQKTNCVGVVFQVGHNDNSDYSSTGIGKAQCHGYVAALWNAGNFIWRVNNPRVRLGTLYGWNGYKNQQIIEQYAVSNSMELTDFPAANACKTFSNPVAPAKTSGWFLPATGELRGVFNSNRIVFNKIKKVDSAARDFSGDYSSSTEHNSDGNYLTTVPAYGYENNGRKSESYPVRPILAF